MGNTPMQKHLTRIRASVTPPSPTTRSTHPTPALLPAPSDPNNVYVPQALRRTPAARRHDPPTSHRPRTDTHTRRSATNTARRNPRSDTRYAKPPIPATRRPVPALV